MTLASLRCRRCAKRRGLDDMGFIASATQSESIMREEGSNDPVFVAIQMSSAEKFIGCFNIQRTPAREAIPSREGDAGRRRLRRRRALEALFWISWLESDHGFNQQLVVHDDSIL